MQPVLNETLAVLGRGAHAASAAMREALRFKTRRGSLIVHDASGRGAMILSAANKMALERRRVIWVDLADRRHPVSLFQPRRSEHLRRIWARVLQHICAASKSGVGHSALEWAAEAAWSLSAEGSVGLGALMRCLSSPEMRRWFLDSRNEPSDLGKLLDSLAWALSFPSVHAVSEGENRGNLLEVFGKPSVVWLESATEHFEPKEHLLVQVLVEAAIEDALLTLASEPDRWMETMKALTVVHLYPAAAVALPPETWVNAHRGLVRHVGVHRYEPDRPLPPQILPWAQRGEFLWVAGPSGQALGKCHGSWLSSTEAERIGQLERGELWLRSNRSGRVMVTRLRDFAADPGMANRLRSRAAHNRKVASIDQVAYAVKLLAAPAGAQRELYASLCEVETLRTGWFRVRESRSRASGVDQVTVSSFEPHAESELATLAGSLMSGQYRCRPLRRIPIAKPDGGTRNLGLACVRDRIVQAAALALLEPIFEPGFSRFSFGFRHGRNAHQAIAVARAMIASGKPWVVIADIRKCFDSIDHGVLLGLLARRIADEEFLALIRHWLTVDVLEFRDLLPTEVGVPQGESISPLLANVYLDPLDRHFERLGVSFVRYADDFLILGESEEAVRGACGRLADFLRDVLHLELKPAKTFWVPVSSGFDFLGFRIADTSITVQPERTRTLLRHLSGLIRGFGAAIDSFDQARELSRINSIVRGWRNYFLLPGDASLATQLKELDAKIDEVASAELPATLRDNPAWLCRERLSAGERGRHHDSDRRASLQPAQPGTGYPGEDYSDEQASDSPEDRGAGPPGARELVGHAQPSNAGSANGASSKLQPFVGATIEDGGRLYILTHGVYVSANNGELVLRKRRQEIYRRPISRISLVYLQGFGISVSVDAQVQLAEHDVPVVLALPLGNPVAIVNPIETSRSSIRRLQAIRRDEPDVIKTGMSMIAAKISNQAAVLKYFAKYRKRTEPAAAVSLAKAAENMQALSESVIGLNTGEANIRGAAMGFEGHAASIYWRQVATLVPGDLGFGGRITLAANDPVNQCLNYIYGVLYGEVWRAVVKAGLDPYFGLVHGSVRDQGSLVFDLIEEFRAPFADRVLLGMLGRGFRPEIGRRGFLRTRSKRQLVRSFTKRWSKAMRYRSRKMAPVDLLTAQANSLVKVFSREGGYHPYRMRW